MNRMTKTVINGEDRYLNYSIEIMFDVNEKFGNINNALETMEGNSIESFEAVKWFAIRMANDGELCRRSEGYDSRPMLSENAINIRMHPLEFSELKNAVVQAITNGYRRDIEDEDKEIDVGLEELNAKKA